MSGKAEIYVNYSNFGCEWIILNFYQNCVITIYILNDTWVLSRSEKTCIQAYYFWDIFPLYTLLLRPTRLFIFESFFRKREKELAFHNTYYKILQ